MPVPLVGKLAALWVFKKLVVLGVAKAYGFHRIYRKGHRGIRYLFQDPASRLWWSGSFKHVYRAPQHAYLRWFTPAAPRGLPAAAAAAPPAPSFASAPLLAAPAAQLAAPAASRSQRLQALAREGLRALRARACEPVGLGLAAAEQLQLWRGRLASGADAAPGGASQRAMQWLRAKRQAYQLVLAHRVAAL